MAAEAHQARFVADGLAVDYTPGGAITGGDVIATGSLGIGIAKLDIAASALGALATSGIFDGVKVTGVMALWAALYWDTTGNPLGGVAGSGAFTTTAAGNLYAGRVVKAALDADQTVRFELRQTDTLNAGVSNVIADPGDGLAIPVTGSGTVSLVTAGAETRTLADPTFVGQMLNLGFKTDVDDCVITTASPVNQTGNNTLTFAAVGDQLLLIAIEDGADIEWRIVSNDGVALSTV